MANDNFAVELGERVIAGLYEENSGIIHKRRNIIADRAIEAKFAAAEKPFVLCDFRNKYGMCKLDKGHEGTHTVINLGNDDLV